MDNKERFISLCSTVNREGIRKGGILVIYDYGICADTICTNCRPFFYFKNLFSYS